MPLAGQQPLVRRFASVVTSSTLLHESPIPTLYFQRSLPKLPIPSLDESLGKYLRALEPLVDAGTFAAARADVAAFATGPGPRVQRVLVDWDREHQDTSYINDMWYVVGCRAPHCVTNPPTF